MMKFAADILHDVWRNIEVRLLLWSLYNIPL